MATSSPHQKRHMRPLTTALVAAALLGGLFPALLGGPATAAAASSVSFTLEGCNEPAPGTYDPNASPPDYVCDDAAYTPGNLGKKWEELDLVPHRLTASAGSSAPQSQTYDVAVVADHRDEDRPGYDYVSEGVLNATKSTGGGACVLSTAQPTGIQNVNSGTDLSIYRRFTLTQKKGATCVIDYVQRLALGSHRYPGSSLHSNKAQGDLTSIGNADVPLPVNQIQPQSINPTISASRDNSVQWSISKSASPTSLDFTDTCAATGAEATANASITVTWTKTAVNPTGGIDGLLSVRATNPSSRNLDVTLASQLFTTALAGSWGTGTSGPGASNVAVGAGASDVLVMAPTAFTLSSSATQISAIIRATYSVTLPITGEPAVVGVVDSVQNNVPVQSTGNGASSVTITDVERLFDSSVATDADTTPATGFDPAGNHAAPANMTFAITGFGAASTTTGSFSGGYTLNTKTVGPVSWSSGTQTSSGSVVFNKTLYVTKGHTPAAKLYDRATLTLGTTTQSASAQVTTTAGASRSIAMTKTIPNVLASGETAAFTFQVRTNAADASTSVASHTFNFTAGQTSRSHTFTGLGAGTYHLVETAVSTGWGTAAPTTVDLTAPNCLRSPSVSNGFAPATATVVKATNPAGQEAGWTFGITGGGLPEGSRALTTGTGAVGFERPNPAEPGTYLPITALDEGTYTITETLKTATPAWYVSGIATNQTGMTKSESNRTCSFTVNYPADANKTFSCTFTNTQKGTVAVAKTENGGAPTREFTFTLNGGPDNVSLTQKTAPGVGNLSFGELKPGSYTFCEKVEAGWKNGFEGASGWTHDATAGTLCNTFTLAAGSAKTFTINNSNVQGNQRTIGYWKNHNSLANGNQWAKAQANGFPMVDSYVPMPLGNYVVPDVNTAVAILSNASMTFAENGLAAQLLAAKLNVAAGAGTCEASTLAISQGQLLLDTIGYAGPSTSKKSGIVGSKHSLYGGFAAVHKTLDDYNNGKVCPVLP